MDKNLILVNEYDQPIGMGEKMEVHHGKQLHRAFSIFIFDYVNKKMLLQKRSKNKYHSGGLWTNACCSHPWFGVSLEACIRNRLKDELGLNIKSLKIETHANYAMVRASKNILYYAGQFHYFADFGEVGENEIDHVFLYLPTSPESLSILPNKSEVDSIKWVSLNELNDSLEMNPDYFTVWFKSAYELVCKLILNMSPT